MMLKFLRGLLGLDDTATDYSRPMRPIERVWSAADMARDLGITERELNEWVTLGVLRYRNQTRWGEYEFGQAEHCYNAETWKFMHGD